MAFLIDVALPTGLSAPQSYVRVSSVSLTGKTQAAAYASYFAAPNSAAAYQVTEHEFLYELEGPNPIKQAYEHLKTLPEFADATDC
jgi:hypothetical protein